MVEDAHEVSVTVAAIELGISRERSIRRIQTRELQGRRDSARGWLVSIHSIEECRRRAAETAQGPTPEEPRAERGQCDQ